MNSGEASLNESVRSIAGSIAMVVASLFAVLIFSDRMEFLQVELPRVWYSSRPFHIMICGFIFLGAALLLRSRSEVVLVQRRPLFLTCRFFTRQQCHLCDHALAVVMSFEQFLPDIEIIDVDISPDLVRQFGESVPVVEIDGKVRFRGAVDATLLQRLIDAAELRNWPDVSEELPRSGNKMPW